MIKCALRQILRLRDYTHLACKGILYNLFFKCIYPNPLYQHSLLEETAAGGGNPRASVER